MCKIGRWLKTTKYGTTGCESCINDKCMCRDDFCAMIIEKPYKVKMAGEKEHDRWIW
jgi:hypothetical protein